MHVLPMIYLLAVLLLLFVPSGHAIRCDPSVELCRVNQETGQLMPVPMAPGVGDEPVDQTLTPDVCGVMGGDGTSCLGCDGRVYPDHPDQAPRIDHCGVCGGDGTSCCGLGWCSHHGMCVEGECQCRKEWTGSLCETPAILCENVECGQSELRGECVPATGSCQCNVGFTGSQCQMRDCFPHGAYDKPNDTCRCARGWTGERCDQCSVEEKGRRIICTGPNKMSNVAARKAHLLKEQGKAWDRDSIHNEIYFDCACIPFKPNSRTADTRALNSAQLEDALNELLVTDIDRFTDNVDTLEAAVEKTENQNEERVTNTHKGVIFAAIIYIGTMIIAGTLLLILPTGRKPRTVSPI